MIWYLMWIIRSTTVNMSTLHGMKMWIVILFSFCLIFNLTWGAEEVRVEIAQGTLCGLKTTTVRHGKPLYSFKSIPYARPNIGLNKFRPPKPAGRWQGVRDATEFRSSCVRFSPLRGKIIGDDDCLFLNVYSPDLNKRAKRAVIFWIHGGNWNYGSGDDTFYGPDFLIENDVVLVTCNYRLGATGFLNTGDANAPGNVGLMDQVMAMKWVQDNIEHFSGSKSRVTIFGQGSGAASVQYHLISPMSKGLFSGAIIDSGTVAATGSISYTPLKDAHMLADALGIKSNCTADLVQQLALMPTKHIVEVTRGLYSKLNVQSGELWLMRPSLETNFGQEMFLPGPPWELIKSGEIADVPMVFGILQDDAKYFTLTDLPKKVTFTPQFDRYIPSDLNITDPKQREVVAAALKEFYFHDKEKKCNINKKFPTLVNDVFLWHGVGLTCKIIKSRISSPVWQFMNKFYTSFGFFKSIHNVDGGVLYGDDLQFIFYSTHHKNIPEPGSPTELKTNEILELCTNFAKYRDPTAVRKVVKIKWAPMGEQDNYLDYGTKLVVKKSLWKDRLELWEKISKGCLGNHKHLLSLLPELGLHLSIGELTL